MRVLSSATALAIAMASSLIAQEDDPFVDTSPPEEKGGRKKADAYKTTASYTVTPSTTFDPELVSRENWPKIDEPVSSNPKFRSPDEVWMVKGGYFAAFDGGEWGGALFFAKDKDTKWTRIIGTHIQQLECIDGETFLATGGQVHMSLCRGAAFLVTRTLAGEWEAREVFHSEEGIPVAVGTSSTGRFGEKNSKKLVVFAIEHAADVKLHFGVDSSGTVHYLGVPEKAKREGQPAPAPAGGGEEKK